MYPITKHNAMQTYGGLEVQFHAFLTTVDGVEGLASPLPAALPARKEALYTLNRRLGVSR